jgi:hypothetical protein
MIAIIGGSLKISPKIATPMFKLHTKDANFVWDSQCQDDFGILKENYLQHLCLKDQIGPFHFIFPPMP